MSTRTISTLKFVGSISLGLLTGVSYSLSTLTIPALLELPSATLASQSYHSLASVTRTHVRSLAGVSTWAFLFAFYLSPRGQKHPYLIWTSLFAASSSLVDQLIPLSTSTTSASKRITKDKGKKRQMDASYEVLGDSHSEGMGSSGEEELERERYNGEEVRGEMEGEIKRQVVRTLVAGLAFAMSVVGIWGDGGVTEIIFVS